MHFISIFASFTRSSSPSPVRTPADCNDPRENANLLGTICDIHGCQRQLDEAPVIEGTHCEGELARAKRDLFPNSWRAVISMSAYSRGGWFRHRRPKMIAVRYCEQCRAAAEKWLGEHVELRG